MHCDQLFCTYIIVYAYVYIYINTSIGKNLRNFQCDEKKKQDIKN